MAHLEHIEALSSHLLSLGELDDLAGLTITFRTNRNGATHAPECKALRSKASETLVMTVVELRETDAYRSTCRWCGGGILAPLTPGQRQRLESLIPAYHARAEAEREAERERIIAQRLAEADKKRADNTDHRAYGIIHGWEWDIERELPKAASYSEGITTTATTCPECDAPASITFEARILRVAFTCSQDAEHGFHRSRIDDEVIPRWIKDGREYIAASLVAPVLAGADDAWERLYGTRAHDYFATVGTLADFDAAHPEPLRLAPDILCGECGGRMHPSPAIDLKEIGERIPARYSCDTRHADGKYRHRDRSDVDGVIDRRLFNLLRDHPAWASAPEWEPSPETLNGYADYLTAKIAVYDAHIGTASADTGLSQLRSELNEALKLVATVQERGALATAGLAHFYPISWYGHEHSPFNDLARALLTTRVEVTETGTTVSTRIDEGTELRRTLRVRELRAELAGLEQRQQEIAAELAAISEEG